MPYLHLCKILTITFTAAERTGSASYAARKQLSGLKPQSCFPPRQDLDLDLDIDLDVVMDEL